MAVATKIAELTRNLNKLLRERRKLARQLKPFEGRELSDEEKTAYQDLVTKVNELDERVAKIEEEIDDSEDEGDDKPTEQNSAIDNLIKRFSELLPSAPAPSATTLPDPGRRSGPQAPGHTRDLDDKRVNSDPSMVLRGWSLAPMGMATRDHQEAAERMGFSLQSGAISFRLMDTAPRSKLDVEKRWESQIKQYRAQSTLSAGAGGNLIQTELQKTVELALLFYAPMRQYCQVIRTALGNPLDIPFMNDTANRGEIVTENTSFNAQDVSLSKVTLNSWLYNSKMINVSLQLMLDSAINVSNLVGDALGQRLARIQTDHFTTGSGTGQPAGLCTASVGSSLGRTATSPTALGLQDILALVHSVDRAYRDQGLLMMHDQILLQSRLIVDAQGRPIFQQSYIEGEPDRLLGQRVAINNSMASTIASTNKTMLYGAFQNYIIRDVMDITIRRLDERYAELGQVAFIGLMMSDGRILYNGAIKHLIH